MHVGHPVAYVLLVCCQVLGADASIMLMVQTNLRMVYLVGPSL